MFYRLRANISTAMRLDLTPINMRKDSLLHPFDFERRFEKIEMLPEWPSCELCRAPKVDEDQRHVDFQFPEGKENEWIPDVWAQGEEAVVSQKARRVIEEFDDFGHQFWPTSFLDHQGHVVNDMPYYLLNVRRMLEIEELGLPMANVDFSPLSIEKELLPTIQNTPALREKIETLPLWRCSRLRDVCYLNEEMVARLREADVTGMDDIVKKHLVDEECLGHV